MPKPPTGHCRFIALALQLGHLPQAVLENQIRRRRQTPDDRRHQPAQWGALPRTQELVEDDDTSAGLHDPCCLGKGSARIRYNRENQMHDDPIEYPIRKGSACASPACRSTARPEPAARLRARSSMAGVISIPV